MADDRDLERRLAKLENRVEKVVQDVNKVNVETAKRVNEFRAQVSGEVKGFNTINQKAHDHIAKLEKRFLKFDKWQKKTGKFADPKIQQKQTMKLVDSALKAYNQKKRK